ncbi:MAG: acid phosphatase [Lacunisphaera sp.]|nr:acid phosphatase [Lacunisphaera sp.]
MKRIPVLLAALWLAATVPAPAQPMSAVPAAPKPAAAAHFIGVNALDLRALVPEPPAPDSLMQRAELDVVYHLQVERTPAQVARARSVDAEDLFVFASDVVGPWFNPANLPKTTAFFALVSDDMNGVSRAAKVLFHRRRPPFLDARIKPCVEVADSGSYPSGHGVRSALWAGLLSAAFPEHAAGFAARADETRWCRLLAGVHNPSDVEAGRVVGEAMVRELLKDPAVQKALEEIRAEAAPFLHRKAA